MNAVRSSRWEDACTAAAVLAVDPAGIAGISVRSAAGPVRDEWLAHCPRMFPRSSRWQRVPLNVGDDRLLGGLDLAATLRAGRPVAESGILAAADGGVITLCMAERLSSSAAARIGCVMDRHEVVLERDGFTRRTPTRFAVIALDEGIEPDEQPPQSLLERLALHVDLNGVPLAATREQRCPGVDTERARGRLTHIRLSDEILVATVEVAAAFGVASARAIWFALRVARALAALEDRSTISELDLASAVRLVFAPRATQVPTPPAQEQEQPANAQPESTSAPQQTAQSQTEQSPAEPGQSGAPDTSGQSDASSESAAESGAPQPLAESVLAAARSALPPDFLDRLPPMQARRVNSAQSGRSGGEHLSTARGRPTGSRAGELRSGVRISLVETLRAAAPWQPIRRLAQQRSVSGGQVRAPLIRVAKDDIRIIRFVRRNRSTTIFLVDASGSASFNRLAEVKGAVELMLAESYVRRDRVALISFRGSGAQLLLPPTNSLVRAKRELASLPGGGGTPLATGIDTARLLADSLKRRGESPVVVVLTDGRPNVARDGKGSRTRAEADAVSAARMMRTNSITSLMVDTAPQPRVMTENFAREMGAIYVPLPYADSGALANAVHQCSGAGRAARDRHV